MKLQISREALRQKILSDVDGDVEAGVPAAVLENLGIVLTEVSEPPAAEELYLRSAFGTFLRFARKERGLTVNDLATRIRVDAAELEALEHDPHVRARPRTIHLLAQFYGLPPERLMKLARVAQTHDTGLRDAAMRFAAKADDVTTLSGEESALLHDFVRTVIEQ
jgi:transcriptional regulator with XRE-family HTH domain